MLGDILYSKAFSELTRFDPKIAYAVSQSVTKLSVGEMMDVEMAEGFNCDRQHYLTMLYLKTATLIEACAYCAALLVDKDADAYGEYGKNLGLAFQIVDDILDVVGDEKTLGKPAMNDFVEGKSTLPYIDLYDMLNVEDQKKLITLHKKVLNDDEKQWIRTLMQSHEIIQKSYDYAQKLCDDAIACVGQEDALRAIITNVISRDH
jgi:octaprenyl-diphosphate synthase